MQIGPYEVDFLWRDAGLVVEVDSYRHHSNRRSFRTDRAATASSGAAGST